MKKLVITGGGAAGMMAAITAAESGAAVTLLEPNERLGKKLNITGKGRCNLTNDADLETLLANTPGHGKFLYSAFSRFGSRDTMNFFENLGVALKIERGNRVFPRSDRAFDVSAALERRLHALHVKICRDRALHLITDFQDRSPVINAENHPACIRAVQGEKELYSADAVILATGGLSYPATGSTGDGYALAQTLGHTVTPLRGSLVPLQAEDCAALQGLTLKNIALTVFENQKKCYTDFGELLFTHFGVSGPVILSASAHMRHFDRKSYTLSLDLKSALDETQLDRRILSDFRKYANRSFANALGDLLPAKLIPVIVRRSCIPPDTRVHDITREQRHALLKLLKCYTIPILAPCPVSDAIVTSGGINLSEVDPKTMASRLIQGLYFAGEILDVDAYTGGFNLQIAWSTGRAAGLAAAQN